MCLLRGVRIVFILKGLHLLLRVDAYIYIYSLLIIRLLLYGRDYIAVTI
jgi:hypothetical protein